MDKWHKEHKDLTNKRERKYAYLKRKSLKQYWITKKGNKCSTCSGEFEYPCYDFHHLNTKEKELLNIFKYSPQRIEKEMQNCILICANCHRLLHYKERELRRTFNPT